MSTDYYSKDFAKQFRQEFQWYSPVEEYQHGNLLFMQLAGGPSQIESLAIPVAKKLYHAQLIYRLICKVENEDIPQTHYLCKVIRKMSNEFNTYVQNEPYTSHYYKDLIAMLDSFYSLTDAFKKDIREQVSDKLKKVYTGIHERSNAEMDDYDPDPIAEQIELYLKNMLAYYNHFIVIWQNETDNSNKGIRVTTQVADYLSELISFIEQLIGGLEDTHELLLEWESKIDMTEEQALFN